MTEAKSAVSLQPVNEHTAVPRAMTKQRGPPWNEPRGSASTSDHGTFAEPIALVVHGGIRMDTMQV